MQHIKTALSGSASSEVTMKLKNSTSDQNVFITYVCLINDVKPTAGQGKVQSRVRICSEVEEVDDDTEPIQVERSKALHELVESRNQKAEDLAKPIRQTQPKEPPTPCPTTTSGEDSDLSYSESGFNDPKILKLTKMKWLTESQGGTPDSSLSLSPAVSTTSSNLSNTSKDSEDIDEDHPGLEEKYLSTILRLDKEHNLFGLSNIAIVGSRQSRKIKKDEENKPNKPVFPQTAIVQFCLKCSGCTALGCCRHKSKTDFPKSLKCGAGCRSCCLAQSCVSCVPQRTLFNDCTPSGCPGAVCPPKCVKIKYSACGVCPKGACSCLSAEALFPPDDSKCPANCYGVKIKLIKRPKPEEKPVEIEPRSKCILTKPVSARTCHHTPHCIPPGPGFPFLLPCYWPARPAQCTEPDRCFHNPTCPESRRPSLAPEPQRESEKQNGKEVPPKLPQPEPQPKSPSEEAPKSPSVIPPQKITQFQAKLPGQAKLPRRMPKGLTSYDWLPPRDQNHDSSLILVDSEENKKSQTAKKSFKEEEKLKTVKTEVDKGLSNDNPLELEVKPSIEGLNQDQSPNESKTAIETTPNEGKPARSELCNPSCKAGTGPDEHCNCILPKCETCFAPKPTADSETQDNLEFYELEPCNKDDCEAYKTHKLWKMVKRYQRQCAEDYEDEEDFQDDDDDSSSSDDDDDDDYNCEEINYTKIPASHEYYKLYQKLCVCLEDEDDYKNLPCCCRKN